MGEPYSKQKELTSESYFCKVNFNAGVENVRKRV